MTTPLKKNFFLIPSLASGGSERVFSILANHLDTEKWAITVVVLNGIQRFYTIDEKRVQLIDLQTPRVRQSFFKIIRLIRSEKPDLVVSTLTHLNQFIGLVKPFLPNKTRFIARESTILSVFHQKQSMPRLRDLLIRRLYPSFDALVCQSQRMANDFKKNYHIAASKLKIINNPVDTEGVSNLALSAKVPTKKARFRFVSVGRLSAEKGIDKALRVLASLETHDFDYQVIGEGRERERLENLVKTLGLSANVQFQGVQKNPFSWIKSANFLLLTSDFEGFPNVLLEAGAVGTPVIAFSCGGVVDEIITNGTNGFVVQDGDEAAFKAAILRGCSIGFNSAEIQNLTKEKFGVTKIVAAYDALFSDVMR